MFQGNFWGMPMMWFIWLPIILLLFFAVMKMNKNNSGNNTQKDSPLGILKKRYAKGEITKEQFEEMKKDLSND